MSKMTSRFFILTVVIISLWQLRKLNLKKWLWRIRSIRLRAGLTFRFQMMWPSGSQVLRLRFQTGTIRCESSSNSSLFPNPIFKEGIMIYVNVKCCRDRLPKADLQ